MCILPSQYGVIGCVCARRQSCGPGRKPPTRCLRALLHAAPLAFLKLCSLPVDQERPRCCPWVHCRQMKWVCRRFSVAFYAQLPVERRNWMDNPKADFLCVFATDKTLLLHKHSPSCSNRLANLILKHFSVSLLPSPHPIVPRTSWRRLQTSSILVACWKSVRGLLRPVHLTTW